MVSATALLACDRVHRQAAGHPHSATAWLTTTAHRMWCVVCCAPLVDRGLDLSHAMADDLARRGWASWNIEYRRVGFKANGYVGHEGAGWPGTLQARTIAGACMTCQECDDCDSAPFVNPHE